METVKNQYDIEIDFNLAILVMDDTIRGKIHRVFTAFGWYESDNRRQLFFTMYCQEHRAAFKEEFEPNKKYPVW